jgi:hypothetical protein
MINDEQSARDQEIAQIIRSQLGTKFSLMVGASHYTCGNEDGASYLEFRFKMFPKANRLRIILDANDTYRLRFFRLRGADYKVHHEESGIYADQLHERFRKVTGLETRMPRISR